MIVSCTDKPSLFHTRFTLIDTMILEWKSVFSTTTPFTFDVSYHWASVEHNKNLSTGRFYLPLPCFIFYCRHFVMLNKLWGYAS